MVTGAEQARVAAGLSLEQAAAEARIGLRYLRRIETRGDVPYVLATRLAFLYQCDIQVFLFNTRAAGHRKTTRAATVAAETAQTR